MNDLTVSAWVGLLIILFNVFSAATMGVGIARAPPQSDRHRRASQASEGAGVLIMNHRLATASAIALFAFAPLAANACATCGCSLSSDAVLGYSDEPGWRIDLQYSDIDQSQLRIGTHSISASQVAAINDNGGDQEVEKDTTNRYLTLGVAGSCISARWAGGFVRRPNRRKSRPTAGFANA